ncbi:REP-associated tyrosine transposase [Clostridium ihumii]|uniref:REP-associated tyrosine transposase n=1 Tax=Clostridium ihumii TaxID=1470356 RepID=UPI003D34CBA1
MKLQHYNELNNVYFITTITKNRKPIFNDKLACDLFINLITYYKLKYSCKIYAFVIMPNHIHFIIQISNNISISTFMKLLKGTFSRYYNELSKNNSTSIFQEGFYDNIIKNEFELSSVMNYIHNNPIKANIAYEYKDYFYSSYTFFYENDKTFNLLLI